MLSFGLHLSSSLASLVHYQWRVFKGSFPQNVQKYNKASELAKHHPSVSVCVGNLSVYLVIKGMTLLPPEALTAREASERLASFDKTKTIK
jgi:hypothetical protein